VARSSDKQCVNPWFSEDPNFPNVLSGLDRQRKLFVESARTSVENDLSQFHGVSSIEFQFLVERKDSTVKDFIQRVINDDEASQSEKEYVRKIESYVQK
jgi:hypothetical protein